MKSIALVGLIILSLCWASTGTTADENKQREEDIWNMHLQNQPITLESESSLVLFHAFNRAINDRNLAYLNIIIQDLNDEKLKYLSKNTTNNAGVGWCAMQLKKYWMINFKLKYFRVSRSHRATIVGCAIEAEALDQLENPNISTCTLDQLFPLIEASMVYPSQFFTLFSLINEKKLRRLEFTEADRERISQYKDRPELARHLAYLQIYSTLYLGEDFGKFALDYFEEFKMDKVMMEAFLANAHSIPFSGFGPTVLELIKMVLGEPVPKTLSWIGRAIKEANVHLEAFNIFPQFHDLQSAFWLNIPLFIDRAMMNGKINTTDVFKLWETQADGFIYALQNDAFVKVVDRIVNTYADIGIWLSFSRRIPGSCIVYYTKQGNSSKTQQFHRALMVAMPYVVEKFVNSVGYFDYKQRNFFLSGISLLNHQSQKSTLLRNWRAKRIPSAYTLTSTSNSDEVLSDDDVPSRLALACYGKLSGEDRKGLILMSLRLEEYDIAYAALRVYFYMEIMVVKDKVPANRRINSIRLSVIKNAIKQNMWSTERINLSDPEFKKSLLDALLPSLRSGYKPFTKFALSHFIVSYAEIAAIDGLEKYYHLLLQWLPPTELMEIKVNDQEVVPLAMVMIYARADERTLCLLNRLITYMVEMNPLQVLRTLQQLYNQKT